VRRIAAVIFNCHRLGDFLHTLRGARHPFLIFEDPILELEKAQRQASPVCTD
jgi:hypothetical protein